jgi:site-specific recombinase XerD
MHTMHITETAEFRKVDRMAVVAWKRKMEQDGAKLRTVRRRLSALPSLFAHLLDKHVVDANPVREIRRPRVNRKQGTTLAFSPAQARELLDVPDPETLQGLRDRAILSVGLQVGPRRAEIAGLKVKDFHMNAGYPALHFIRKGGEITRSPFIARRPSASASTSRPPAMPTIVKDRCSGPCGRAGASRACAGISIRT